MCYISEWLVHRMCMQCDRLTRGGAYVENMCGSKEMQSELEARLQKEREGNFHGAAE